MESANVFYIYSTDKHTPISYVGYSYTGDRLLYFHLFLAPSELLIFKCWSVGLSPDTFDFYGILGYIEVYWSILGYIGVYWGIFGYIGYIGVYWGILGILGYIGYIGVYWGILGYIGVY